MKRRDPERLVRTAWWSFIPLLLLFLSAGRANAQCTPVTPPYSEDFESTPAFDVPACMTVEMIQDGGDWFVYDGAAWGVSGYSGNVMIHTYDSNNDIDSWLFTEGLDLTAGSTYRLRYLYGNDGTDIWVEKMAVWIGTAAASASMTDQLIDHGVISETEAAEQIITFTVPTTGTYNIGFHCYSDADQDVLVLDDISVIELVGCTGTPDPGNTTGPVAACDGVPFTLGLSNNLQEDGLSYQWYASTDGTNFSQVGTDSPTYSATQSVESWYYCEVTCTNGGSPATSTTLHVEMGGAAICGNYCIPTSASNCSAWGDIISNVTIAGINRNSSCDNLQGNGYSFFSNEIGNLDAGSTGNTYSVSTDGDTEGAAIWIDYNQDGVFSASELVFSAYSGVFGDTYTGTFNVPANALGGLTRMRVVARYAAEPTDPCAAFSYGETEDYLVEIEPLDCMPPTAQVTSIANNTATLDWTDVDADGYNWEFRDDAGNPGDPGAIDSDNNVAGGPVSVGGLTYGNTYTFWIQSVCGSETSPWASTEVLMDYCVAGASNETAGNLKINNVTISLDGTDIINNNSTSLAGYEDFTGTSYQIQAGVTYDVSILDWSGADADRVTIWVDLNQDFMFTPDEMLYREPGPAGVPVGTNNLFTGTIYIPASAELGETRMRIRLDNTFGNNGPQDEPCGYSVFGQVEDYTLDIQAPPACLVPEDLVVSNITDDNAEFSWTAQSPAPDGGYEWEVRDSGNPGDAGAVASGSGAGNTADANNQLQANTAYTFYVRSLCTGEESDWASKTFRTACAATASLPFSEDFESVALNAIPFCWESEAGPGNSYWRVLDPGAIAAFDSKTAVVTYDTSNPKDAWLYTPGFELTGGVAYRLKYRYISTGATWNENLEVRYGTGTTSGDMTEVIHDHGAITTSGYGEAEWFFTPATTDIYYLGFHAYSPADRNYVGIDDVQLEVGPTCFPPEDIAVTDLAGGDAELTWTDNGADSYNYEVRTSGEPGSGNAGLFIGDNVASGTPAVQLTGLTNGQEYTIYVQALCDNGNDPSEWSVGLDFTPGQIQIGSGSATTTYLPIYTLYDYSYSQQIYLASELQNMAEPYITKIGFKFVAGGGSAPYAEWNNWTVYLGNTAKSSFSGNTDWVPLSGLEQVFSGTVTPVLGEWMMITLDQGFEWDGTSNLVVAVTENVGDWTSTATWAGYAAGSSNRALLYYADGTPGNPASPPTANNTNHPNLAQIRIVSDEVPDCLPPTGLNASNITLTDADFSWNASTSAPAGYEWEVREAGTQPGDATGFVDGGQVAGTTASTNALSDNTPYSLFVRADCGGVFSPWAGPYNFMTPCGLATLPYEEDFDASTSFPHCMSQETISGNAWSVVAAPAGMTGNAARYAYNVSQAANSWMFTQGFTMEAGTNYMIMYAYGNNGGTTFPEKLAVAIGNSPSAASMTQLADHNVTTSLNTNQITFSPATTGDYYVGFQAHSAANEFYLYVDDIVVFELSDCSGDPDPGATTGPAGACAGQPFEVGISNDPGYVAGYSYQWEVSTDGTNWSNAPGASTGETYTATQTEATWYRVQMSCDFGGGPIASTPLFVAMSDFMDCYCTPQFAFVEEICNVTFADINNTSSGGPAVEDFTTITAHVNAGSTYKMTLTGNSDGPYTNFFTAFFDWDQDGIFETMVEIGSFTNSNCAIPVSKYVMVPPTAPAGISHMRIIKNYGESPTDPCGSYSFGQVEDYSVEVAIPTCFAPVPTVVSLSPDLIIDWADTGADGYEWELRNDEDDPGTGGELAADNVKPAVIDGSLLTPGETYTFFVRALCDGGNDPSDWAPVSATLDYCEAAGSGNYSVILIGNVEMADIANPSSSMDGYEDFTSVVGHVNAGEDYTFTVGVTGGYDADRVHVWIDFNQDLIFSPDEKVLMLNGPGVGQISPPDDYVLTGNVHISAFALAGQTRMRVRIDNTINGPNGDPCGPSDAGQVEDYTLDITAAPCIPATATTTVIPDCDNFEFSVDVTVTDLGDGSSITVSDNQGSTPQSGGLGTYTFGPYINATNVSFQVSYGTAICDAYYNVSYACTPPNTDCNNAIPLAVDAEGECNPTLGSLIGAPSIPMTGSGCINNTISLPAVYYSFVATTFAHEIYLQGAANQSTFNVSVFDGCNGNELSCAFGLNALPSLVSGFVPGNTYIARVVAVSESNFTICVTESGVTQVDNDDCANATPLTVSDYQDCTPFQGTLEGATDSGAGHTGCANPAVTFVDVWYSFVAENDRQILTLSHQSAGDIYGIALYLACNQSEVWCDWVGTGQIPEGDEISITGFDVGEEYLVRIYCRGSVAGPIELCVMNPPGPTEVDCGGPAVNETYCMSGMENNQWAYHSNGTGDFTLTFNSGLIDDFFYHKLIVYDGPDANSPILFQNAGFPDDPTDLTGITVTATGADLFMTLETDGFYLYDPCFSWTVACAHHADDPCDATPVACGISYPGNTSGLGNNVPNDACVFNGGASTGGTEWWSFTADEDGQIFFSTCNDAGFDTRISVFSGADCDNLGCLAMNDDAPGCANGGSVVTVNVTQGETYWIMVTGAGSEEGAYTLEVQCQPPCAAPANDDCANAASLVNNLADGSNSPATYTNVCATVDNPTSCSGTLPVQGVWFTFNSGDYDYALLTLLDHDEDASYTATNLDYALFTGSCDGMGATGSIACVQDAAGLNVLNVDRNTTYSLLVYNTGGTGVAGTFGIMVEHPAHNDAAITAIHGIDPGQYCSSSIAPEVTLLNNADEPLTSVDINYGLDGAGNTTHTYAWTGNLAYGQSVTFTLPTVTVAAGNGQTLTVSTSLPNGEVDEIPANDSQSISGLDVGGEGVRVIIRTNNNPSASFSWSLWSENFIVFESGGPYDSQPNTTIDEFLCLSTDDGNQFHFSLSDAEGNGLCCGDGEGYWELRAADGGLLLRDIFDANIDGYSSPIYPGQSPAYGFGHSFNLPAGPVDIHPGECGIMDNHVDNKVYAVKQAGKNYQNATLNYQFEFANPDSGRIRRIAVPRNYVIFSEMAGLKPLVPDVTYFARVRTDKSGPLTEAYWGTGCEMALEPQNICTQLIDDPNHQYHSCGVTKRFKKGNWLIAEPVYGAQQYEFRVYIPGEYEQTFLRNNYKLELGWAANQAPGLVNGSTYHVQVRVKVNNVWGNYCGDCSVTIDNSYQGSMVQVFGEATLWPNPVRDGQVNLNIDGITSDVQHITVDIKDIYGQHVYGQEFENFGERFNTVLNLPGDIASGVYMVDITINGEVTTKRLSIVR